MKLLKPSYAAALAACSFPFVWCATALADSGEKTPVDLTSTPTTAHASAGGGGTLVHTLVGLAIVLAVIYGLYWVLKQVKASREEKASGSGLAPVATLPLGAGRSLHMVRAGSDVVLLGVTEHGVTPIKTYAEKEAERVGLFLDDDGQYAPASDAYRPAGSGGGLLDELRRRTVRR